MRSNPGPSRNPGLAPPRTRAQGRALGDPLPRPPGRAAPRASTKDRASRRQPAAEPAFPARAAMLFQVFSGREAPSIRKAAGKPPAARAAFASPFFNMSRALSIDNEGAKAIVSRPWPYLLAGSSVRQRVPGSMPARRFNVSPSRMKHRCISLLRPALPCRLALGVCGGIAAAVPRKNSRIRADARRAWGPGKIRVCRAVLPLRGFRHAADRSAPACQLARHRDVRYARLLVDVAHLAAPVDQPPHAGVGVVAHARRDLLAPYKVLQCA